MRHRIFPSCPFQGTRTNSGSANYSKIRETVDERHEREVYDCLSLFRYSMCTHSVGILVSCLTSGSYISPIELYTARVN